MARYKPESRDKIKRDLTDRIHKADDRAKHIKHVVKDAKVTADVSQIFRSAPTVESANEIEQAIRKAGNAVGKEFHIQEKDLVGIVREFYETEQGLRRRTRDSNKNASDLVTTASSIKETFIARSSINQARGAALEDAQLLDAERKRVRYHRRKVEQILKAQKYQVERTRLYQFPNNTKLCQPTTELGEIDSAVHKIKNDAMEGNVISENEDTQKNRKPVSRQIEELEEALSDAEMENKRLIGERGKQNTKPKLGWPEPKPIYKKPLDEKYKQYES
ncbi:MAG: hypothetical protein GY845_30055 [Planctomycetes bacterium]|nr:hypothetical protein [Planctomycetota bacterium]